MIARFNIVILYILFLYIKLRAPYFIIRYHLSNVCICQNLDTGISCLFASKLVFKVFKTVKNG